MALLRHCDICNHAIENGYIKLNASIFGKKNPIENKRKIINLDLCTNCFNEINHQIEKIKGEK